MAAFDLELFLMLFKCIELQAKSTLYLRLLQQERYED